MVKPAPSLRRAQNKQQWKVKLVCSPYFPDAFFVLFRTPLTLDSFVTDKSFCCTESECVVQIYFLSTRLLSVQSLGCRLDNRWIGIRFPTETRNFSDLKTVQWRWSPIQWERAGFYCGEKRLEREAVHHRIVLKYEAWP